ncbi:MULTISPECIES: FAD-dependent oxidoreductase [unclassified Neptuniibacter]|uniref:flavin-dependent monooxygenase QhpG n=1 Tax=unclassified Neptuniibacter TaxID=2630693 RepID=UPI000C6A0F9A|nr:MULTISPECIES: FAD-dependent oxidoreductase [unclassified Neptuniibacter]MAY41160.1 FAD-dependent oxidoreductase [Oceanospirillaceae bacterium]
MLSDQREILILGGGPSGAAVALGLQKLGYKQITLVTESRPFKAMEGISERVVDGLRGAGFKHAIENLPEPSARFVTWNGESNQANTEQLIDRVAFDNALMVDLAMQGIHVIQGRIESVRSAEFGHEVSVDSCGQTTYLSADFLVEARGRAAPSAKLKRLRGAETVSLLQYWQGAEQERSSAVQSFENGWAWLASDGNGRRYLQLTFDVASTDLPEKSKLVGFCNEKLSKLSQAQPFLEGAEPTGELYARTSTPILCEEAVGLNWIRVGDAAMSVDPLSGNGIFQTLSSSLQAPAVINTLITKPAKARLAQQFHQLRITELFYRFARIGRDFYMMEKQWPTQPFWKTRSAWPDKEPIHQASDISSIQVCQRPVVKSGLIELVDVVVTADQPLGIWHLSGIPLAPVVQAYRSSDGLNELKSKLSAMGFTPEQQVFSLGWLRQQGAAFDSVTG